MALKRVYIGMDNTGVTEGQRALRTDMAAAAIRTASDWGAGHITVADSGGLLPERLPPDAFYIETALPWGGLEDDFGAAILFGPAGEAPGWAARDIARVCLGGVCADSPGLLCALMAGGRGLPVAAAIGCGDYTDEVKGMVPEAEAVILRQTLADGSLCSPHPGRAGRAVADGILRGLRRIETIQPVCLREPIPCEVDFLTAEAARRAALIPGVARVSARRVGFAGGYREIEPILALILCYIQAA